MGGPNTTATTASAATAETIIGKARAAVPTWRGVERNSLESSAARLGSAAVSAAA